MIMRKYFRNLQLSTCLAFSLCICINPIINFAATPYSNLLIENSNSNEINSAIGNLDYNKYEILSTKGDSIESFTPREGKSSSDKFIVVEREKKSLSTSPVDISIVDSIIDRTYPGALQLANNSFIENKPDMLICKRNPLNISIDLPGMKNKGTVTVDNPTYGNVSGAIDELISTWNTECSSTHTLPARTQYSESMVYSKSQIAAALNVNQKLLTGSLGIDFNAISNGEKKVMIVTYKQIFYTVSAELPNNPSDVFHNSVTFSELSRKGVSNSAPPLMVSNVAYGRTVYIKLETNSKSTSVESAFKALLNSTKVGASAQYKDILDNSSFTAVVLGGDSKEHNKIITKDFDEIRTVLKDNSAFSIKNPGYPISYTSVFLKDNSIAAVHNKTDYIETTSTEYSKGKISLDHSGAYVAQFKISWDEFSYDKDGKEILVHKTWDGNYSDKTAHFSTVIPLKPNTKNIRIYARECTGLAWEWWRTIIDQDNISLSNDIKVSIWGTTLYPYTYLEL